MALLTSCGRSEDSPEDNARSTIETMLAGLREADGERVCESLTAVAAITLAEEDCARAISRAAPQGKAAMRALGDDKIRDVDVEDRGATVKTTGATWYLEEVGGDYLVNDASAIGEAAARDPRRAVR